MNNKPPCKKGFLAKTVQDLGRLTQHFDLAPPEGHDLSLKALEQQAWDWFAQVLHPVGLALHDLSLTSRQQPMDRRWGIALNIAYAPATIGSLVVINVPPSRAPEGSRDCVGLLLAADRERTSTRLYAEDGGPVGWGARYHLQRLDGSVQTWGNCTPRALITHRTIEMCRTLHRDVYGARNE
ncbi:hypothetical protein MARCHEWKA_05060 [Brevundimonas phage vB_BpoS-Marchewka]|uniref:Uncharacterized protein n=1 Tax=Brevundimonas phage vB_BpoS-Marchewka TaxID=2948604 RepID=A0A9E7N3B0_9CAUD|nr:hypothetical protein MARCHEWKA_05060 [Brevundimonas phage vB_BpoS-Marchewka]